MGRGLDAEAFVLCPECGEGMTVVDAGVGDPGWVCPVCRTTLEYSREDEEPSFDYKDDPKE